MGMDRNGPNYRNGHLSVALSTLNAFYMHKNLKRLKSYK